MSLFSGKKKQKEFEKVYDENVDQIFRFVYLKVSSKDDAEDLTSKAFTRLWETMQKKEEEIRDPRALLYSITRNMVVDYYRKHRPKKAENKEEEKTPTKHYKGSYVPLEDVVIEDGKMRADEAAKIKSEMELVRDALSNLNDNYQNVIIWYYLDELTTSEIADLLEKPENSVRVLLHRAVSALKKELQKKESSTKKKK